MTPTIHLTRQAVAAALLAGLLVGVLAGAGGCADGSLDSGAENPPTERPPTESPAGQTSRAESPTAETTDRAKAFLERYVDDTGRVVRIDQGGDTVSEGQAYALLIALGARDAGAFDRIWSWTSTNLQRPDGLLSWHWQGGAVTDDQSASDADLDAARALVVAGRVFERPDLTEAGRSMGRAILELETVPTAGGRVLLPGPWAARRPPYLINPSYFSPVAAQVMHRETGDPQWAELEEGSRAVLRRLASTRRLVPDWARIDAAGAVEPAQGPRGEPIASGSEAGRAVVRLAESCTSADRRIAATQRDLLTRDASAHAALELTGLPLVDYATPLAWVARAAAVVASGDAAAADKELVNADGLARERPTYYGDAWAVLGRMMLGTRLLDGCPSGVAP